MYLATSTSYPAEQKITVSDDWHGCIMFSLEYWDSFVRHSFSFCVVLSPPLTVILLVLFCVVLYFSCKLVLRLEPQVRRNKERSVPVVIGKSILQGNLIIIFIHEVSIQMKNKLYIVEAWTISLTLQRKAKN